jgi:beta-galactosidase/beta-glucuronidase
MEVITEPSFWFDDLQVYPDIANHQAKVVMKIYSLADTKSKINIAAESFNTTTSDRHQKELTLSLKKGEQELVQYIDMGKNPLLWSEFSPAMYRLKVKITNGQDSNTKETDFGMREFSIKGKYFYINGTKVVLRGTVENCDFPLTGYAPMDEKSWERVLLDSIYNLKAQVGPTMA